MLPPATDVTATDGEYPRAYVRRPLVLPQGIIEATAQVLMLRTTFQSFDTGSGSIEVYAGDGRVRYGFGGIDFEAGGQLLIGDDAPDELMIENERFRAAFGGVRAAVAENLIVGANITYVNESESVKRYAPRVVLTSKQRFGAVAAIELGGFGGFDYRDIDFPGMESQTIYTGGIELRPQAQVSPVVALEARATIAFVRVPDMEFAEGGSALTQNYGLRLIASLAPKVDLLAGVDYLFSGEANQYLLSAGIAGRLP